MEKSLNGKALMKIAVFGTGMVGNALGTKLVQKGHEVMMGSRNAKNESAQKWASSLGERAHTATFRDAAEFGEVVIRAAHFAGSCSCYR
jgi:predicted dinucleotide-binding enzyme